MEQKTTQSKRLKHKTRVRKQGAQRRRPCARGSPLQGSKTQRKRENGRCREKKRESASEEGKKNAFMLLGTKERAREREKERKGKIFEYKSLTKKEMQRM